MAFRAFRSNPAIGGFSEGIDDDVFPQVLKELVDNAVDACRDDNNEEIRRVRVQIENENFFLPSDTANSGSESVRNAQEVLRITVTDNGCGMEDIEKCVCPFESNKTLRQDSSCHEDRSQTAGRYGIGLTLCMLHAQRLVPHSHTTIKSAIASAPTWTSVKCVVDSEQDVVHIVDKRHLPKDENKSGTAICIVVPGGNGTKKAWPRLAEYFARFHLSIGIKCSLEVLAPFFSNVPLFIRPPIEVELKNRKVSNIIQSDKNKTSDFNDFVDIYDASIIGNYNPISQTRRNDEERFPEKDTHSLLNDVEDAMFPGRVNIAEHTSFTSEREDAGIQRRKQMKNAFSSYLKTDIDLKNVAHSFQKIRRTQYGAIDGTNCNSTLEVDVVICQRTDNDFFNDEEKGHHVDKIHECCDISNTMNREINKRDPEDCCNAKLMVIRMVNRIPLLDSAEASACGVVRCASRRMLWNTIGLEISTDEVFSSKNSSNLHVPTFCLRDSAHVTPFLTGKTNHSVYKFECIDGYSSSETDSEHHKKRKTNEAVLHPVGLRMGSVYILVQLNADPSELPLPTLSKGRLPMNDDAIDKALHSGILSCFRSLQRTNPTLFLSVTQLKQTELNAMYIPAFSQGISSMIVSCSDESLKTRMLKMINDKTVPNTTFLSEAHEDEADEEKSDASSVTVSLDHILEAKLSDSIEKRIRVAFACREVEKSRKTDEKRRMKRRKQSSLNKIEDSCDADFVLFPE